jgi:hypothetical protein
MMISSSSKMDVYHQYPIQPTMQPDAISPHATNTAKWAGTPLTAATRISTARTDAIPRDPTRRGLFVALHFLDQGTMIADGMTNDHLLHAAIVLQNVT